MFDDNMKTKYKIIGVFALVLLGLIALPFLCSCGSRKTITETIHTHDTLIVLKTDTVRDVKVQIVIDTVKQIERHEYTLNNVGDTVKEIHHYNEIMRTLIVDSTERYQAKVDSLQRLVDRQKMTSKVVKKIAVPWWAWIVVPAILIGGLLLIVRKIKCKK